MSDDLFGPKCVYQCAVDAYNTSNTLDFMLALNDRNSLSQYIVPESCHVLNGQSGWFGGSTSPFGFIAQLKKQNNHIVVATRGTRPTSVDDWLTNLTVSVTPGPGGDNVHEGFYKTYQSMSPQVIRYIDQMERNGKKIEKIHCVGHSLGGALANLNANGLRARGKSVALYTVGEPRVGLREYAECSSKRILAENIYRVRHELDVVTMLPCFNFMHAPYDNDTILLDTGFHPLVYSSHLMPDGYKELEQHSNWCGLRNKSKGKKDRLQQCMLLWRENDQFYLEQLSSFGGGFMSGRLLSLINAAIDDILKRMGTSGLVSVGKYSTGNFTVLDQLSEIIFRFGQTSMEAKNAVGSILKSMLNFLGKALSTVIDVSIATLRWVIGQFIGVVTQIANRALTMVG